MPLERRICRTCGTPDTVPAALCTTCGPVSGIQVRDAAAIPSVVCEGCDSPLAGVATSLVATCLACGGSAFGWRDGSGSWSKYSIEEAPGGRGPWIRAVFDGSCSGHDPIATGALIQNARRFDLRITDGILTDPVRVDGPPAETHSGEDPPIRQIGVPAVMIIPEQDGTVGDVGETAQSLAAPPAGNYRVSLEDFRLHEWTFIGVESPALRGAWSTGRVTGTAYGRLNLAPTSTTPPPEKRQPVTPREGAAGRVSQWVSKNWEAITPPGFLDPGTRHAGATIDCPSCNRWLIVLAAVGLWWFCGWRTGLAGGATLLIACAVHGWLCRNGVGFHRWREPWRFRASVALGLFLLLLSIPILAESIRASSLASCGRWLPEHYAWLLAILLAIGLQPLKSPRWAVHLVMLWALLAACIANFGNCSQAPGAPTETAVSSETSTGGSAGIGSIAQTLGQSAAAIVQGLSSNITEAVAPDPDGAFIEGLNSGSGTGLRLVSVAQAAADPQRYLQCVVGTDGRRVPGYSIYLGYDAFFSRNSDKLKPSSTNASLRELLAVISAMPQGRFVITGHTDTTGNDEINIPLSRARAEAVVAWLASQGVDRGRLEAVGEGSSVPLVRPAASFEAGGYLAGLEEVSLTNDLRERINRRVEVAIDCPRAANR